jgi:hypothetical protein
MAEFVTDAADLSRLTHDYREYFNNSHATHSPIYRVICASLADDPAIGGLALRAAPGFRVPLILPAVVHYLLLSGVRH